MFKSTLLLLLAGLSPAGAVIGADGYASHNRNLSGGLFRDVTEQSGIRYFGHGKGVALADFDFDGDLDVHWSVIYAPNILSMNEGGLRFADVTASTGTGIASDTHGAAWADFNNDGMLELFLANNTEQASQARGQMVQPDNYLVTRSELVYFDTAAQAGTTGRSNSCGVTTADINGDGWLDAYVATGALQTGPSSANYLYINEGDGTFTDQASAYGVANQGGSYCCAFSDWDNDGDYDLFVGGLRPAPGKNSTVTFYQNNGDGSFTDVTDHLGLADPVGSLACFFGDVDNDGDADLFYTRSGSAPRGDDLRTRPSDVLLQNDGNGRFTDISESAGITSLGRQGRGCAMGDLDNDGDLDIYVTNAGGDAQVWINDGRGRFTDRAAELGGQVWAGHGCALGDLDGDGDLDVLASNWRNVAAHNWGRFRIFENRTDNNFWLKVKLVGRDSNRSAVMGRIAVYRAGHSGEPEHLLGWREVSCGNGTFNTNPLEQHFGLGDQTRVDLIAQFPNGRRIEQLGIDAGQLLVLQEPEV